MQIATDWMRQGQRDAGSLKRSQPRIDRIVNLRGREAAAVAGLVDEWSPGFSRLDTRPVTHYSLRSGLFAFYSGLAACFIRAF